MSAPTIVRPGTVIPCPGCGDNVIKTSRDGLLVEIDISIGGLYELNGGIPLRRSLAEIAREYRVRQLLYGGGHEKHECIETEHWTDR